MLMIHILSPGFTNPNSAAFLMPLIRFKRGLHAAGFDIRIFNALTDDITQCDALFIDSKVFKDEWIPRFEQTLERIAMLNAKTRVIWCDTGDSTGTFLGQVMPHVHLYLKAQLLRDRKDYLKNHYASRIWGEYYHQKYGITDDEPYIMQPVKDEGHLNKLGLSWNSGMMNYGFMGPYIQQLRKKFPVNALLRFAKPLKKARTTRPYDVTCRMGIPYPRATMRYQREKIREILADRLPTDKLSRCKYFDELCHSKICVSPFGLGEITLKDFECFLTGAMLFKPDMDHMQTWPNFFEKDITYLAHDWDLETVEEKIEWALDHEKERLKIAQAGQDRYCQYTVSNNSEALFVDHFLNIAKRF